MLGIQVIGLVRVEESVIREVIKSYNLHEDIVVACNDFVEKECGGYTNFLIDLVNNESMTVLEAGSGSFTIHDVNDIAGILNVPVIEKIMTINTTEFVYNRLTGNEFSILTSSAFDFIYSGIERYLGESKVTQDDILDGLRVIERVFGIIESSIYHTVVKMSENVENVLVYCNLVHKQLGIIYIIGERHGR